MRLTKYEQETIINFNQAENIAYIYTCNKAWMKHLEEKLGLKGSRMHFYAKEYECPKSWIRKPLKPRKLSDQQKAEVIKRLHRTPITS